MNTSTEATRTAPHSDDFQIEALSPVMGASIRGLDVSIPLSEKIVERLKQLLLDYKVLCFREQHLSLDAQLAFTRCWGTPLEHTMADQLAGVRNHVQIATNVGPDGKPNGKTLSLRQCGGIRIGPGVRTRPWQRCYMVLRLLERAERHASATRPRLTRLCLRP